MCHFKGLNLLFAIYTVYCNVHWKCNEQLVICYYLKFKYDIVSNASTNLTTTAHAS